MRRSTPRTPLLAALFLVAPLLAPSPALAQDKQATPLLGGPSIPHTTTATIVHHDAMGRFVQIEGRPEEAALLQLDLEPEVRDAARAILIDRATRIGLLLIEQVEMLRESTDAQRAGDNDRARAIMEELHRMTDPDLPRSPLLQPLADSLPAQDHADLTRMVDEYWDAWIAASGGTPTRSMNEGMDGDIGRDRDDPEMRDPANADANARIQSQLGFTLFQYELSQAYERTLRPVNERMQRIYTATEPTPEQRAAIRRSVIDFVKETGLRPDPESRSALARRIYNILDEERRVKLLASSLF